MVILGIINAVNVFIYIYYNEEEIAIIA